MIGFPHASKALSLVRPCPGSRMSRVAAGVASQEVTGSGFELHKPGQSSYGFAVCVQSYKKNSQVRAYSV
jgi:hypothetical protein